MRVLVTGSNGFIGKNLCEHLKEIEDIDLITFDIEDDFSKIEKNIKKLDFIFHLAGVNRPKNPEEFHKGNTLLTESIINLIKKEQAKLPLLITSSIQALKDNDYGNSKREAEEALLKYHEESNNEVYIYRLHNAFGKWSRPNYNSVVATFCYNLANNKEVIVNDNDADLELIYIDDIVEEFIKVLNTKKPSNKFGNYCYVDPVYEVKLGELAEKIKKLSEDLKTISVPTTGDEFTKKLFSTYLSYAGLDAMVVEPKMNVDDRGSFTELIKTENSGQVSVSVSKPGIFRGNHYHHTKMEKFIVLEGDAEITFEHILTGEQKTYLVNDKKLKIVNIPVGYTHKIENVGKGNMILLLWCNEFLNKTKPDTYFKKITKEKVTKR